MNARHPVLGSHRAMQAAPAQLIGNEPLEALTFAQLLDLQEESAGDDSYDTFNDVARELRNRRDDAKVALVKLFVEQCKVGGMIPMVIEGGKLGAWLATVYLTESFGASEWGAMAADVLTGFMDRDRLVAAMASEYAAQQSEDLLRAGYEVQQ